jgi:hypothetical protein
MLPFFRDDGSNRRGVRCDITVSEFAAVAEVIIKNNVTYRRISRQRPKYAHATIEKVLQEVEVEF